MFASKQPTPYDDVNKVLLYLRAVVDGLLSEHFVGMYLCGSLAVGDFDPRHSDIDLIIVTDGPLSDNWVPALQAVHDRLPIPAWRHIIEAVYIPQEALQHGAPPGARYPVLEKGGTLALAPLEDGWPVQVYTLREHGIAMAGPAPRTFIPPVDRAAMNRAGFAIAALWLEQAQTDPSWLEWLRPRQHQAFVILTLCRLLYTLETGAVASKPGAARWAQAALGSRWVGLIAQAVAGQHTAGDASDRDIADTVALVALTVDRFRE